MAAGAVPPTPAEVCGNAIVDEGEECDDGNGATLMHAQMPVPKRVAVMDYEKILVKTRSALNSVMMVTTTQRMAVRRSAVSRSVAMGLLIPMMRAMMATKSIRTLAPMTVTWRGAAMDSCVSISLKATRVTKPAMMATATTATTA